MATVLFTPSREQSRAFARRIAAERVKKNSQTRSRAWGKTASKAVWSTAFAAAGSRRAS